MPKVTTIPPTKMLYTQQPLTEKKKARVAAYARVSTDQEEQQSSYKAQMDYFTELITSNPEWEFAGMYSDEGITATSMKNRDGFNAMIADALDGKIDNIITKSVSRFARNTVDSLTTIRQLKDKGIDVYFEKENIHTLDAKGELLITIMSSMAQEESRSISENSTWGIRKRMRDGHYSLTYSRFLGYDKGPDGKPVINEEQAKTVRRIFSEYLSGKSSSEIARGLQKDGVPTAAGGAWSCSSVIRILTNEKYKGDALIQKTFTKDFLTHKAVKNNGEVPSYYIEDDHEPIVSKEVFELAQVIRESKKKKDEYRKNIYCKKLICADCGGKYTRTTWKGPNGKKRETFVCYNRYGYRHLFCKTPYVYADRIESAFLITLNKALNQKEKVLNMAERYVEDRKDSVSLEKERDDIRSEISKIYEQISDGAIVIQNKVQYKKENEKLYQRHSELNDRLDEITDELRQRKVDVAAGEEFIRYFREMSGPIKDFNEFYWDKLLDRMISEIDKSLTVILVGGYTVKVKK